MKLATILLMGSLGRFPAHRILRLSASQVLGLLISSVGSFGLWLLAAQRFTPDDVGVAASAISFATLVSTLATSGLGQYLLASLARRQTAARVQMTYRTIALGVLTSAVASAVAFAIIDRAPFGFAHAAVGLFAAGLSLANLQDSVYICAGKVLDVPLKGCAITLGRIALVALPLPGISGDVALIAAIVLPQIFFASVWALWRMPDAIIGIERQSHKRDSRREQFGLLSVGYLYSLTLSTISLAVPATATNALTADQAAVFYVAWMITSTAGIISTALANSIVSSPLKQEGFLYRLSLAVAVYSATAAALSMAILLGAPWVLRQFGEQYLQVISTLRILLVGQFFSGASAILLASARAVGAIRISVLMAVVWLIGGAVAPCIGLANGSMASIATAFAAGNAAAASITGVIVFGYAVSWQRPSLEPSVFTKEVG
jgi:O-antigen/teichoic acid export membrane protein